MANHSKPAKPGSRYCRVAVSFLWQEIDRSVCYYAGYNGTIDRRAPVACIRRLLARLANLFEFTLPLKPDFLVQFGVEGNCSTQIQNACVKDQCHSNSPNRLTATQALFASVPRERRRRTREVPNNRTAIGSGAFHRGRLDEPCGVVNEEIQLRQPRAAGTIPALS
jgi:hypothetical protein